MNLSFFGLMVRWGGLAEQNQTHKGERLMKKNVLAVFFTGFMMLGMVGMAHADILATFTHDYGTGAGQVDPGGNDVLENDFVTVCDKSTLRFNDSFDFSSLNYGSITSFDLTLKFSNTQHPLEIWKVRAGESSNLITMKRTGNSQFAQTFVIDSTIDTFSQMVTNENFLLWFANEGISGSNFKLYDATLNIIGTPSAAAVPVPAAVWLFGSGLVGLAGIRKRAKK